MSKIIETIVIDELMLKDTARLISLLWQREEFMVLPENDYNELLELLKKEYERTKNLEW